MRSAKARPFGLLLYPFNETSVLDTSGMSSQTRKMFDNIKYGVAQCF